MSNTDIADRLRDFVSDRRRELGLTQKQASERAGIPLSTWGTVESDRGTIPAPPTLAAMAKALEIPPERILLIAAGLPESSRVPAHDVMVILGESDPMLRDLLIKAATAPEAKRKALRAALAEGPHRSRSALHGAPGAVAASCFATTFDVAKQEVPPKRRKAPPPHEG